MERKHYLHDACLSPGHLKLNKFTILNVKNEKKKVFLVHTKSGLPLLSCIYIYTWYSLQIKYKYTSLRLVHTSSVGILQAYPFVFKNSTKHFVCQCLQVCRLIYLYH